MAKEFNIARTAGQCVQCERTLETAEPYMVVVVTERELLLRRDWCLACWDDPQREPVDNPFGQWRTQVPAKEEKKKVFVDDDLLLNFFHRLADDAEPSRQNFRFVITLVLMRKRLLNYERTIKADDGTQSWLLKQRGRPGELLEVLDPQLDEDQIADLSEQLSGILQGEL